MFIGIMLVVIAGIFGGICLLPMRYTTQWSFENTWFFWCLFSFVVVPLLIVLCFVPHYLAIYQEVGMRLFWVVAGCGFVAGIASFLMGYSVSTIGVGGANAIANGLALALGSILPLLVQHREILGIALFFWVMVGLILSLAGVMVFALASHYKSRQENPSSEDPLTGTALAQPSRKALWGILAALGAGLLFPGINWGIAFADVFMKVAVRYGSSEAIMTYLFYLPYYIGAFFSNSSYSMFMWARRGSAREIRDSQTSKLVWIALLMALIWTVSNLAYGWAMPFMQGLGPVLGWPIYLVLCNVGAVAAECWLGDWKGKAFRVLAWGMLISTGSVAVFTLCSLRFI